MTTPHQPTRTTRVPFWVLTLLPLILVTLLTVWACDEGGMCDSDPDCEDWERCRQGICEDQPGGVDCQLDLQCGEGFSCENFLCEYDGDDGCGSGAPCEEGYACQDGICTYTGDDGCGSGPPCKEGDDCIDGNCFVSECQADGDCAEGEVCTNSVCVDAE